MQSAAGRLHSNITIPFPRGCFLHPADCQGNICHAQQSHHYPDFIVYTASGKIILVETKGDDRDNSDSKRKVRLGRKWADMAGSQYRYYMVFDENDTGFDGAYKFAEFCDLMKHL